MITFLAEMEGLAFGNVFFAIGDAQLATGKRRQRSRIFAHRLLGWLTDILNQPESSGTMILNAHSAGCFCLGNTTA